MTKKLYGEKDAEFLFSLEFFKKELAADNSDNPEIILFQHERDFDCEYMWCIKQAEYVDRFDNECGKYCKDYKPCNGKSGRCRFLDNTFKMTGKVFRLTKEGLEEKVCLHIKIQSIGAMITEITQALNKAGQSVRAKEFQVRAIGCGEVSDVLKIASDYVGILNSRAVKNE